MVGRHGRSGLPLTIAALLIGASLVDAGARAEEFRDPAGRYSISLGDAWHTALPTSPAVQEWQRGTGEARVRIWVEVYSAPADATGTPLDELGPTLLDRWLKSSFAIAGSSRLGEAALSAQGADAGLAVRLANKSDQTQVIVVLMSRGRTVYLLGVEIPAVHANDRGLSGELSTAVSSFRILGGGGAGGLTAPPPGGGSTVRPGGGGDTPPPDRGAVKPPPVGRSGSLWLRTGRADEEPIRPKLRVVRDSGTPALGGEWPVLAAGDKRASFRDAIPRTMAESWSWDAPDGNKVPAVQVSASGACFSAEGKLFGDEAERPILALPPVSPPVEAFVAVSSLRAPDAGEQLDLLLYEYVGRGLVVTLRGAPGGTVVEARTVLRGGGTTASIPMASNRGWVRLRSDGKRVSAAWSADGLRWTELFAEGARTELTMAAARLGITMVGSADNPAFLVQGVAVAKGAFAPDGPSFRGLEVEPKPDGRGRVPIAVVLDATGDVRDIAAVEISVAGAGWEHGFRLERDSAGGPLALQPDAAGGVDAATASAAVLKCEGAGLVVRLGVTRSSGIAGAVRVRARAKLRSGTDTGWWDLDSGGARPAGA
jgi:hypothetical protein